VKICYIAPAESAHTVRWVKYFADKGHEVHLISFTPFGVGKIDNVNLHVLKVFLREIRLISYPTSLVSSVIQIRWLLRKINPDILHTHYILNYGFLGSLSNFHPLVVTAWGSDVLISPKKSRLLKQFVEFSIKRADLITCDGENLKARLAELGADLPKIHLIYFGIDIHKFCPGQKDEKLIKKLAILDSPVIVSLRSLEPIYDIDSLVNAVPLVLKEVPKAIFLIAGAGSQEAKLRELAKSLGVDNNLRFVGFIPNDELPRYLRLADVYVSTSLSDAGIAVSTAEAMCSGLPVVITDFGDNGKWVEDGVDGFLVPLRNPEALASRILDLLSNKERRIRFGQAGRQIIDDRMNLEIEMQKMEMLYEQLIRRFQK